jgi:hypothetical protein
MASLRNGVAGIDKFGLSLITLATDVFTDISMLVHVRAEIFSIVIILTNMFFDFVSYYVLRYLKTQRK